MAPLFTHSNVAKNGDEFSRFDEDGPVGYPKSGPAWEYIGYGDDPEDRSHVRIKGGRTLYESVFYQDGNKKVKLGRIDTSKGYINQIYRWVDFDTTLELV